MFVIINYGVGNLTSIQNMLKKSGIKALISADATEIAAAKKILFPGMGHFDNCMQKLNASGLRPVIEKKAMEDKIPVLAICVGLQMFMESSEEGNEQGLGWIKGKTIRFRQEKMGAGLKIPNMGWHEAEIKKPSPLMAGLEQEARFYFAHSYHVEPADPGDILIAANYGYEFTAAIEKDNLVGVQFHPEKSHRFGLRLLNNFMVNY